MDDREEIDERRGLVGYITMLTKMLVDIDHQYWLDHVGFDGREK